MRIDPDWQALSVEAARLIQVPLSELTASGPDRAREFSLRVGPLYASFARQRYDTAARKVLLDLARNAGVADAFRALFDGEKVNVSEARPALHTALRSDLGQGEAAKAARREVVPTQSLMLAMAGELRDSDVTDVINVGIGGSDLGPRLAVDALRDFSDGRLRIHFLNNADASAVQHLLRGLDPAHTAVVLVSKSFGTQETLLNGAILKDWLGSDDRLYAVTANVAKAAAFGVAGERVLPMWDWVGGRYSLWSAVGFVVALAIGGENFKHMLAGAAAMDAHVLSTPLESNLAVWHALSVIWNRNGLGFDTHAVMPYDERLALLPAYLQQLVMESLGKSVRPDGTPAPVATVPMLWGGTGTSSQHSFFQALHQGTDTVPSDFVGVVRPAHPYAESHTALLANLLAQGEALANGADDADAQKRYPGNRPSTLFLLDELTPESFGALIAMYEHSVYAQSVIWGINAFDQWGVELGKRIASQLLPALDGVDQSAITDPVTQALLAEIHARRKIS
ncbi:MAG TPA: glucose-6-phosphate isomerase [Arenimonas sp.]|uniref:glucose-6-phosphate isomerase n=1 Tax=Arenimonas sp. TaxID=1872635 RepID=UPI002B76DD82|nr:glucose-6-phosphate isomerase [Arenimonas sp.]HMB57761.1 glucose-6-phosphate isomerase [Arenimonas sp.]